MVSTKIKDGSMMKKRFTVTNMLIVFMILLYIFVTIFFDLEAYVENFGLCGIDICDNGLTFYRYFTSLFMHFFILHLAANMTGLYFSGNLLEKNTNKITLLFSFIGIGILGSLITTPIYAFIDKEYDPNTLVQVGSSIGVFGLIGMDVGYNLMHKGSIKKVKKSYKIVLAIYGILFTYFMNGDNYWTLFAHNIGFILGMVTYLVLYFLFFNYNEKIENIGYSC